ncbi:MAG: glycoside hydrolase domain-containing protein [Armatimonadota bacterium]
MRRQGGWYVALVEVILLLAVPAVPQEVPYEVASWQEEGRGNHRVIVEVAQSADAVRVRIPWRRRDPFPERKAILVFDSATGKQVANVAPIAISQEYGEIVFQPATVPGRYEVYYLPYDPPHWVWDMWGESTKGKYFVPKPTADAEWLRRNRLTEQELAQEHWRSLPEAKVVAIQARTEFDRFDPMEVIATRQEVDALLASHPQSSYLTFPVDRQLPIRMFEHLPYRWILEGPSTRFEGEAQPGEFYPFQIGIYAARKPVTRLSVEISDLRGEGSRRIPASAIRCFNLQGTDWLGRPMHREFSVTVGRVRPLWVGVQIPKQAKGVYRGTLCLRPEGLEETTVEVQITVRGEPLNDAGDSDDWRLSRLRWLDSTIGLEDKVVPPYTPVKVSGSQAEILGRRVRFNRLGLPESIVSNGREILASPVRFVVETAGGEVDWKSIRQRRTKHTEAMVEWLSTAENDALSQQVHTRMEFDGCMLFTVTLQTKREVNLQDIRLEVPIRKEVAVYMMGMGRRGGKRPDSWQWQWHPNRINNLVWVGDWNAGVQVKLEGRREVWGVPLLPNSWFNEGKGGCVFTEQDGAFVLRASSGERHMAEGESVQFLFRLLITPFKPLDHNRWNWRIPAYMGGNIEHVHHAELENPHINYPMLTWRKMAEWVRKVSQSPNLRNRGSLQYPAEGNIWLDKGSLHLHVRVNFDPKAGTAGDARYNQSLFSLLLPGGESIGYYWNIDDRGMRAYLHTPANAQNPYPVLIGSHQPEWQKGEVHTVTLSWGERFAVYVDGKLATQTDHQGTLNASLHNAMMRLEGQGFCLQAIKTSRREYQPGEPITFTPDDNCLLVDTFDVVQNGQTQPRQGKSGTFAGEYEVRLSEEGREVVFSGEPMPVGVNIYYTVRELTNHTPELWVLRGLGDEVLVTGGVDIYNALDDTLRAHWEAQQPGGHPWLKEHLLSGYVPAWLNYLPDGKIDAAIATQGLSRWHNFYLEGLRFMLEHTGIDGLYLDGIGYDREIMKRVRRVMKRYNPNSRIDFHSGDNWSPPWLSEPPLSSPANEYMEHFPYLDTLWFGELYDYNMPPDYWLVEISGIPFGLMGDMLQDGGNPYRGMIYGMTGRDRSNTTPGIWQMWDDFGIEQAEMLGYWRPDCPVRTDRPDVLATVYRKPGKSLIALASWAKEEVKVRLQVDWNALGIRPDRCRMTAPPVPHFQPLARFSPSEPIPVPAGKGWLILVESERD